MIEEVLKVFVEAVRPNEETVIVTVCRSHEIVRLLADSL
jgi:hypothetical protein